MNTDKKHIPSPFDFGSRKVMDVRTPDRSMSEKSIIPSGKIVVRDAGELSGKHEDISCLVGKVLPKGAIIDHDYSEEVIIYE